MTVSRDLVKDLLSSPPEPCVVISCSGSVGDENGLCGKLVDSVSRFANVVTIRLLADNSVNAIVNYFSNPKFSFVVDGLPVKYVRLDPRTAMLLVTYGDGSDYNYYYKVVRLGSHIVINYLIPVKAAWKSYMEAKKYAQLEDTSRIVNEILNEIKVPPTLTISTMGRTGPSRALANPAILADLRVLVGGGLTSTKPTAKEQNRPVPPVLLVPTDEPLRRTSGELAGQDDYRMQWSDVMKLISTSKATIVITTDRNLDSNAAEALASLLAATIVSQGDEPVKIERFKYRIYGLALLANVKDARDVVRNMPNEFFTYVSVNPRMAISSRAALITGHVGKVPSEYVARYMSPTPVDVPVTILFPLIEDEIKEIFNEVPPDVPVPRPTDTRKVVMELLESGDYDRVRELVTLAINDVDLRNKVIGLVNEYAKLISELKGIREQERRIDLELKLVRDSAMIEKLRADQDRLIKRRVELENEVNDIVSRIVDIIYNSLPSIIM